MYCRPRRFHRHAAVTALLAYVASSFWSMAAAQETTTTTQPTDGVLVLESSVSQWRFERNTTTAGIMFDLTTGVENTQYEIDDPPLDVDVRGFVVSLNADNASTTLFLDLWYLDIGFGSSSYERLEAANYLRWQHITTVEFLSSDATVDVDLTLAQYAPLVLRDARAHALTVSTRDGTPVDKIIAHVAPDGFDVFVQSENVSPDRLLTMSGGVGVRLLDNLDISLVSRSLPPFDMSTELRFSGSVRYTVVVNDQRVTPESGRDYYNVYAAIAAIVPVSVCVCFCWSIYWCRLYRRRQRERAQKKQNHEEEHLVPGAPGAIKNDQWKLNNGDIELSVLDGSNNASSESLLLRKSVGESSQSVASSEDEGKGEGPPGESEPVPAVVPSAASDQSWSEPGMERKEAFVSRLDSDVSLSHGEPAVHVPNTSKQKSDAQRRRNDKTHRSVHTDLDIDDDKANDWDDSDASHTESSISSFSGSDSDDSEAKLIEEHRNKSDPKLIKEIKEINGVKVYQCNQCGTEIRGRNNFRAHMREQHAAMPVAKHRCDVCGKKFNRKYNLRVHKTSHLKDLPFKCAHCGEAFAQRSNYVRHVDANHTRPWKCTKKRCEERYATEDEVLTHIEEVHPGEHLRKPRKRIPKSEMARERKSVMFRCKCKRRFETLDALLAHELRCSHDEDKEAPDEREAAVARAQAAELAAASSGRSRSPLQPQPPHMAASGASLSPEREAEFGESLPQPHSAASGASSSPERERDQLDESSRNASATAMSGSPAANGGGALKLEHTAPVLSLAQRGSVDGVSDAAVGSTSLAGASLLKHLLRAANDNPSMTIADFLSLGGLGSAAAGTGDGGGGLLMPSSGSLLGGLGGIAGTGDSGGGLLLPSSGGSAATASSSRDLALGGLGVAGTSDCGGALLLPSSGAAVPSPSHDLSHGGFVGSVDVAGTGDSGGGGGGGSGFLLSSPGTGTAAAIPSRELALDLSTRASVSSAASAHLSAAPVHLSTSPAAHLHSTASQPTHVSLTGPHEVGGFGSTAAAAASYVDSHMTLASSDTLSITTQNFSSAQLNSEHSSTLPSLLPQHPLSLSGDHGAPGQSNSIPGTSQVPLTSLTAQSFGEYSSSSALDFGDSHSLSRMADIELSVPVSTHLAHHHAAHSQQNGVALSSFSNNVQLLSDIPGASPSTGSSQAMVASLAQVNGSYDPAPSFNHTASALLPHGGTSAEFSIPLTRSELMKQNGFGEGAIAPTSPSHSHSMQQISPPSAIQSSMPKLPHKASSITPTAAEGGGVVGFLPPLDHPASSGPLPRLDHQASSTAIPDAYHRTPPMSRQHSRMSLSSAGVAGSIHSDYDVDDGTDGGTHFGGAAALTDSLNDEMMWNLSMPVGADEPAGLG